MAKPIRAEVLLNTIAETLARLPQARPAALNNQELLERVGGSQRHADMLVQVFRETYEGQLQELEAAFARQDLETIKRLAGSLQTSLHSICAQPAARAARTLEQLAGEARLGAALHARRQLWHELEHLALHFKDKESA